MDGINCVVKSALGDSWSKGEAGQLISRVANGEPAARKSTAMEIGRFGFQPGNAHWEPQLKLRIERGRIAARSDASATMSWTGRL